MGGENGHYTQRKVADLTGEGLVLCSVCEEPSFYYDDVKKAVLDLITNHPNIRQIEICDVLNMKESNVSKIIAKLRDLDIITKDYKTKEFIIK